jgi:hypothetical protein
MVIPMSRLGQEDIGMAKVFAGNAVDDMEIAKHPHVDNRCSAFCVSVHPNVRLKLAAKRTKCGPGWKSNQI